AQSLIGVGLQQISRTIQDNTFVKSSPQALEWNGSTLQKTNQPDLLVPGQQVMEPQTFLGRLAAGQRSLQINDGTGNFVSVVVNDEGVLTNHIPIMGASPFGMVGPGKGVKFFGAAKTIGNGANLSTNGVK